MNKSVISICCCYKIIYGTLGYPGGLHGRYEACVGRVRVGARGNRVLGREVNLSVKDCYKLICSDQHVKSGESPMNR